MALPGLSVRVDAVGAEETARDLNAVGDAAVRNQTKINQANKAVVASGQAAQKANPNIRMMSMQLSQVAQQGAATGQWAQAFAIQAADIGLAFGTVGIAIGAAIPVITSLASGFINAGQGAEELEDKVSSLRDAISRMKDANSGASSSISELNEQFGQNAQQALKLLDIQKQLANVRAVRAFQDAVEGVSDVLGGALYSNVEAVSKSFENLDTLIERRERIFQEIADAPMGAAGQLQRELQETQDAIDIYRNLSDTVNELTESFGISEAAARDLVMAATEFNGAANIEDQVDAGVKLADALDNVTAGFALGGDEAYELYQQLLDVVTAGLEFEGLDLSSNISSAAGEATRLADEIQRAVNNAIDLSAQGIDNLRESELRLTFKDDPVALAGALAAERFGDISGLDPVLQSQLEAQREAFIQNAVATEENRQALIEWRKQQSEAASAGGALSSSLRIDALVKSLMTEEEVLSDWYATSLEMLNNASNAELEALGGKHAAIERLEKEHQDRLNAIKEAGSVDALTTVLASGQQIAAAIGQNNEKAAKIAQAFAATEALVNTYRAAAQALADPQVPFWGKFAAVAAVVSNGIGLVNAIKSASSGGGSTASTASAATANVNQAPQNVANISITGLNPSDMYSGRQVIDMVNGINEYVSPNSRLQLV